MPSVLPEGDPAPADGSLPAAALDGARPAAVRRSTCTCRSARCAAATATSTPTPPTELGGRRRARRLARTTYADAAVAEVRLRPARCWATSTCPSTTVFFGGGTPTLLPPGGPACGRSRRSTTSSGSPPGAEVTTESNPDSVDAGDLARPARRRHQPDLVRHAVGGAARAGGARPHARPRAGAAGRCAWAREAGLRPGQPGPDLRHAGGVPRRLAASLDAALACEPDHVSAYALIVEDGTALARQVRRGDGAGARRRRPGRQVPPRRRGASSGRRPGLVRGVQLGPRPPAAGAGTTSATGPAATGGASGPGAHSHVGGVRWWNVKHPAAYAERIAARASARPTAREVLDEETRRVERVLLETRLREGLPVDVLDDAGRAVLPRQVERGLVERGRTGAGPGGAHHARTAARRRRGPRPAAVRLSAPGGCQRG